MQRLNSIAQKRTVLITGASSGIGFATAKYFQQKGWNVVATMRNIEDAKELAVLSDVLCVYLDVTVSDSITQAIAAAVRHFGTIDAIVNNAGFGTVGALEAASEDDVQKEFDVNVFGCIRVIKAILPVFRKQQQGTIINISSMGGRLTFPLYSLYHSTKWAIEGLSESLQYELRPLNIRVKVIEPGAISTHFYSRSMHILQKEGVDAYRQTIERALPRMNAAGQGGAPPIAVAKVIYRAANDCSWRLRFPAAGNARTLLVLKKFLPDAIFAFMVRAQLMRKRR